MMMNPAPASAFIVSQTQLLLQLLIVALDDPAVFRHLDQRFELGFWRQRRYPIFAGFGFPPRPLDRQPFFRMRLRSSVVPARRAQPATAKPQATLLPPPLPPTYI